MGDTESPCLRFIQVGFFHKILRECKFQKTKTVNPVLTSSGILIPNDTVKVYKYDANNILEPYDIFQSKTAPVLLDVSFTVVIIDKHLNFTFAGRNTGDMIVYSKLSEIQLKMLMNKMTA